MVDDVNIGLVSGGRKEMKMYSLEKGAISKYGNRKNKRDHICVSQLLLPLFDSILKTL